MAWNRLLHILRGIDYFRGRNVRPAASAIEMTAQISNGSEARDQKSPAERQAGN